MKKLIIALSFSFSIFLCFGQQSPKEDNDATTVPLSFLKWYKIAQSELTDVNSSKPSFSLVKDIPVNKSYKRQIIDKAGVEKYISFYRKSGFLSEEYLDDLKSYFNEINKALSKRTPIKRNEMIKIDGLDLDLQLQTFEPEVIFDNLDKATVTKSTVIDNKALLGINFAEEVNLVFALTKHGDKWLIDYMGHDNSSLKSFFRQ